MKPASLISALSSPRFNSLWRGTVSGWRPSHFIRTWEPLCLTGSYPSRSKARIASSPERLLILLEGATATAAMRRNAQPLDVARSVALVLMGTRSR